MLNPPPPQVLQGLTAWLGTVGTARGDLRERPERPVAPVRRVPRVSQAFARRRCVWLLQRTPPRDYRRREQSKDPMFRELSLREQLTTPGREGERGRPSQQDNIEDEGVGDGNSDWVSKRPLLKLTTWSFDWWDTLLIIIPHITMTTAAHSHPHP